MEAQTLNCPNCGATAATTSTRCSHCNSRLATTSCPQCFGMLFLGARFCPHCGAKADRQEFDADLVRKCPRCRVDTVAVVLGKTNLRECPRCEGLWVDAETLQKLCTDREQRAAVLGVASPIQQVDGVNLDSVRYVPCPVCSRLMNRVNFARCSNVVVDVCRKHGTWFDKDELRRIVEFIQAGGLDRAREQEIAELERQRRTLASERVAATAAGAFTGYGAASSDYRESALADIAVSIMNGFIQ